MKRIDFLAQQVAEAQARHEVALREAEKAREAEGNAWERFQEANGALRRYVNERLVKAGVTDPR